MNDTTSPNGVIVDLEKIIKTYQPGPACSLKKYYKAHPLLLQSMLQFPTNKIIESEFLFSVDECRPGCSIYESIEYLNPDAFEYIYDKMSPEEISLFEWVVGCITADVDDYLRECIRQAECPDDYSVFTFDRWLGPHSALFVNPSLRGVLHEGPILPRGCLRGHSKQRAIQALRERYNRQHFTDPSSIHQPGAR